MSPQNQVKPTKKSTVNRKKPIIAIKENWRERALNSGILISNILEQIGQFASVVGLQQAAVAVSTVLTTIEKVQANKKDFQIIADDASDLVIAIWHAQEEAKNPKKWLSNGVRDMVKELTNTLNEVSEIALKHTKRNIFDRVIFYMADAGKIRQAREKISTAVMKFQVVNHLKANDVLLEMLDMMKEISEQIKNRNESENMPEEEVEHTRRAPRAQHGPTPPSVVGSNSASISGFSFSNTGSGTMHNQNVGNIVNTTYSEIGNKHSENHIYGYISKFGIVS